MQPHARRGFTLIELLVVVAIIALLIAILLPSLGKAKTMALRTKCVAGMKGWGVAVYTYQQQYDGWFVAKVNGGTYGGQWDQNPKAYGIPLGASGVPDSEPANGTSGSKAVIESIYGAQMGNVSATKSRFCPADTTDTKGAPGVFYYGTRPLPGYRMAAYRRPSTAGPTGAPSLAQRITQFRELANTCLMLDAASANNYGEEFSLLTHNQNKAGPGAGTVFEGLNNNAAVPFPRDYNGQGWNTQQELKQRHGGYGGVLFLDGHADIVPYSDYVKNIPNSSTDGDMTKRWTLFPR